MRPLFLFLVFFAHTAFASVFPAPASPEQPVSPLVFSAPAGDQQTLGIASDGNIGFVVWIDHRRAANDLYGLRIDANGVSLDPRGILIATGATGGGVIWNGNEFLVVSQRGSDDTFTFVTTEGTIVDRKTMTLLYMQLAATMGSGPDARILFVGAGRATIIDSHANIVMDNVQLAMPVTQSLAIAGAGANEFLVLHTNLVPSSRNLFADRLDRDGKLLGTADTGVDHNTIGSTLALAGGDDGYLLIGRGVIERDVIAAHLDRNGVVTSQRSLATYPPALRVSVNPPAKPAVLRDGDHYEVVWTTSEANGDAHTWRVIEPLAGGASTEPARILNWTGSGYGATIGKMASQPVVVTDVFRTGVSTSIDPVVSVSELRTDLSSSASLQTTPQVASSANGYAVLWNEFGPDGSSHLYLRLSSSATPLEVASNPAGHAIKSKIAASGETYVVAFATSSTLFGDNYAVRRFSATNGWLDAEPVPLANAKDLVLGANGDGALAVYTVACNLERCLRARTISKDPGALLRSYETIPADIRAYQLSIAGNGHDYLIAFNDNACSPPWCNEYQRSNIVALRLGEEGRTLDSRQIVLDDTNSPTGPTSIAWSGSNYAVSWTRDSSIVASHVSSSGVTDAAREILPRPSNLLSQKLVGSGAGLLLFTQQTVDGVTSSSGVALDPQSLLPTGEPALLVTDQPSNGSFSAAGLPSGVAIAYDRVEQAAANVARVFTRTFSAIGRRRATR